MRVASAVVPLTLAVLLYLVAGCLQDMVDLAFSAGAGALSTSTAWTGLLALGYEVWFLANALIYFYSALTRLLPEAFRPRRQPLRSVSFRVTSVRQLWDDDAFLLIVFFYLVTQHSLSLAPVIGAAMLVAWCLLERRLLKGRALWHRLPGFFGGLFTFAVMLVALALVRSAGLVQAWQYGLALAGHHDLFVTSLLLGAQMFTDFHVLLMLVCTVVVLTLPRLMVATPPRPRWQLVTATMALSLFALGETVPAVRTRVQSWLANGLGQGNGRVLPGGDGWLFDTAELRALTGTGPLAADVTAHGAPLSPAKDEVLSFARQLKARGVPLLLIPIPMKASLYPEAITRTDPDDSEAPLNHPDQETLYAQLIHEGIDVQDITGALMQLKARHKEVFFKQDTHWTPDAMQELARAVAVHVRKKYPGIVPEDPLIVDTKAPDASGYGDLAARLYSLPEAVLSPESAVLVSFPAITIDPKSAITLLGDDYAAIYDNPGLGYAAAPDTHASFTQHLALYLGTAIDAITINHGATTEVRKAFSRRFEDEVRAKKLVIWLIPARDLILPPSAHVDWSPVTLNPASSPPQVLLPMVPKGR